MSQELLGEEKARLGLMARTEYVRAVRPFLPAEAFRSAPRKIWGIAVHSALLIGCVLAIRFIQPWWARLLLSLFAGHSLACLAFFGHDLSHGSIVRRGRLKYLLELWVWSLRMMPVTMWRRLHNQVHHAHSNTPLDCDRRGLAAELNGLLRAIGQSLTPMNNPIRWNPLVGLAFIGYTIGNLITAFRPGKDPRFSAPYRVAYGLSQRARLAFKVGVIVLLQAGIFFLAGLDLEVYLWCGPLPVAVSSAITIAYIFTNHFLNVLTETEDVLLGTTSVGVPPLVDWLHGHFSYHTEHHLFPSLNSSYYPLVGRMLEQEFPDRYHRIPLTAAWQRLWSVPFEAHILPRSGRPVVQKEGYEVVADNAH